MHAQDAQQDVLSGVMRVFQSCLAGCLYGGQHSAKLHTYELCMQTDAVKDERDYCR